MEKIEIIYLPKSQLKKLGGNPRKKKDPKAIEKLARQIEAHGFQNPLQVWKDKKAYTILCGNHRYDAGLTLGMTEFPCIVYQGTWEEAQARSIADNKSNEWTEWDLEFLKPELIDLDTGLFDMKLTGFDRHEIELMMTAVQQEEEKEKKEPKVRTCPSCGFIL